MPRFVACALLFCFAPLGARLVAEVELRYEVAAFTHVLIPMRDGVKLATDVYRPARNGAPVEGRFPALLLRTPYNKTDRAAFPGDSPPLNISCLADTWL